MSSLEKLRIPIKSSDESRVIFPGSFNPFHVGHANIVDYINKEYGQHVDLEISLDNVDKDSLNIEDIIYRLDVLKSANIGGVWITKSPKFIDKSIIFRNKTFLVGGDTITRLFSDKYTSERKRLFEQLYIHDNRILAFNRANLDMSETIKAVNTYHLNLRYNRISFAENFSPINISSTEIREQNEKNSDN